MGPRQSPRQSRSPLARRNVPTRPGAAHHLITHGTRCASPSPPSASHPTAPASLRALPSRLICREPETRDQPINQLPTHTSLIQLPVSLPRPVARAEGGEDRRSCAALRRADVGAGVAGEAAGAGGVRRGRGRGGVPRGHGLLLGPLRRRRAVAQAPAASQPCAAHAAARPLLPPRRRRAQLRPAQLRAELRRRMPGAGGARAGLQRQVRARAPRRRLPAAHGRGARRRRDRLTAYHTSSGFYLP